MALINKLKAIADAIRGKTGKSDSLTLDQMATEIAGIQAGGGSLQKASGVYVNAVDGNFDIDISDIGFIPDLAFVSLDETDFTYDSAPTKAWALYYIPFLLDRYGVNANPDFTHTNLAHVIRGAQGTNTLLVGTTSNNYVGYHRNSDPTMKIYVAQTAASYPVIAGTYKWECYKIWEDE